MAKRKVDNNYCLPYVMRLARRAKPHKGNKDAWWYISPGEIDIYVNTGNEIASCTLTRKQLERALEVMTSSE